MADRLGQKTGIGSAVAFASIAIAAVGMFLTWFDQDGFTMWFMGANIFHPIGLILFGLAMQAQSSRWKALPIAVGGVTLALMFLVIAIESDWLFGLVLLIFGVGWAAIGQIPSRLMAPAHA